MKIGRSTKRCVFFYSFILLLHTCYICVGFQPAAFVILEIRVNSSLIENPIN